MNFKPSKGEQRIEEILTKNGISFKKEVSFTDLYGSKDNNLLRFDFAIFKNNQLICLLEYDGEQAKEWDRRKNAYCIRKNIPLIRIPYWDYEKLSLSSLFSTKEYYVKNKFHNDYLIK